MAELEQSFDEHDMSEFPENSFPDEDNLNLDMSGIPENSQPDEDNAQLDMSGIPEISQLDEDNVKVDMSVIPENSQSDEDNVQLDMSGIPENSQLDVARVQPENDSQPKEQQEYKDTVLGGGETKWPGWPGESVFRLLVPTQKVGGIIGHKGEFIKKMCEETRARIKILDGPRGISERAVLVSAKEDPDASVPPAVAGLLSVLKRVVDGLESDPSHAPPVTGGKVSTRLLAPAAQAGSLIGKQGTTVKSIQEASSCIVRVLGTEDLPLFALQDDRIVEVVGEPLGVHKAVELIASHLRKFLVDRSVIPIFEMQMQMPNPQMEQHMPPAQQWGPPPQAFPQNSGGPGYGPNPHYMPPPRQYDNYYPSAEMPPPPMEKQPHHGISAYGREAQASMHAPSNAQPAPSMVTQVTQQMQIPLSYADAVIGSSGTSISYIRRASGATVAIQETRGVPGEMTVEISGTASQVQTAQQLLQNSMAEAAGAAASSAQAQAQAQAQVQAGVPPTEQGYNPYVGPHGSVYTSPPSTAAQSGGYGQTPGYGQASGAYGSAYGANYGY